MSTREGFSRLPAITSFSDAFGGKFAGPASLAEAAFATTQEGRILAWNDSARQLLGHEPARILGSRCHETLQGTDAFGNRFCAESCALRNMTRRREALHPCEVFFRHANGERVRIGLSVVVVPAGTNDDVALIHILQDLESRESVEDPGGREAAARCAPPGSPAGQPPESPGLVVDLTPRELQVLRLLSAGISTRRIAGRLAISDATVRNHVESVLRKLRVHSRLQAVAVARKNRLI